MNDPVLDFLLNEYMMPAENNKPEIDANELDVVCWSDPNNWETWKMWLTQDELTDHEYERIFKLCRAIELQAISQERERAVVIAKGYAINKMVGDKPNLVVPEKLYRELLELNQQMDEIEESHD